MKLIRLKADGFGVLRGEYRFAADRLNLVMDRNERGKTSLLHAIVAGLYGLDGDGRRHRNGQTPLDRWRPWDGGTYRVELDVESEGETYTIIRDFGRGTTQVWNGRAQDVTPEFLTDRDEYSAGQTLLGLDADEFTKCAFWRQGELADVVPDQEKDRRASTLRARLESAADTRSGDASAIEAIAALDSALARVPCPELGSEISVDHTLKRLELKRDELGIEIHSLEDRHRAVSGSLEQIARLGEQAQALRSRMRAIDARRVALRTEDARRRLDRDAERMGLIERLRGEAASLEPAAGVSPDAESALKAQVAALRDANARREGRGRDRAPLAEELAAMDARLAAWADVAACSAEDAQQLGGRADMLRHLGQDEARLIAERERALGVIRANGLDPLRAADLLPRFARMSVEQVDFMRERPLLALEQLAATTSADQSKAAAATALREIGLWRLPRYVTGGVLVALGMAAIVVGVLGLLLIQPTVLIGAGAAAAILGIVVMLVTSLARRATAEQAAERIATAREQLLDTESRVRARESRLDAIAKAFDYTDSQALITDWEESQRLRDLHGPAQSAEQQLQTVDQRIAELTKDAHTLLERAGGGEPAPERLEAVAARIRQRIVLAAERAALVERLAHVDDDMTRIARDAESLAAQARATATAAGITAAEGAEWPAVIAQVQVRVRSAARHRAIVGTELPALERERLDAATLAALRAEIEAAKSAGAGIAPAERAEADGIRTAAEAETRIQALRREFDQLRERREAIEREIHGTTTAYHERHPALGEKLEAIEAALRRTERFRDAVLHARGTIERVARETHRRWADFLNERVTGLLKVVGSNVSSVRFGEDLDFALTPVGGTTAARGKVVHQLSSGARDQLHLAVRLAISEFLSRGGERLPFLIDDCFSTSDDERATAGMRLLIEGFSREHQIVLVTCHRQRYETLATHDPALYDNGVNWLELRAEERAGESVV